MKLSVKFHNCTRPRVDRIRLETEFRDAMLNYCPSVERLSWLQQHCHWEYMHARQQGVWAIRPLVTDKEFKQILPMVRIE